MLSGFISIAHCLLCCCLLTSNNVLSTGQ